MKNDLIIADSSALFSLLVPTDQNYIKAYTIGEQLVSNAATIIIPEEVFSELINIIGKKFDHKKASLAARYLLDTENFLIDNTNKEMRETALAEFNNQPSSVSFTDCLVMAFADHFETKIIFGFDEAFSKNGYKLPS